ncbi:hypothetical protein EMPS_07968 [Entomortierella parvispora]|uniref:Uncharacterized protein n=1 Tax=Entomortierella parvispora TaxID=205924 RepID=A0A9P3LZ64_9FUNG|nr:hypothetical protein EMPS_07968 [Entomortierella parvispora]
MSSDITAAELALEALLESRLESIATRLQALTKASQQLKSETFALAEVVRQKQRRVYVIEDYMLRLQGKPGVSNLFLENGAQPRRNGTAKANFGQEEIEEIKMGFKTLRRKFQAAGNTVTTVGWWRHLKGNGKQEQGQQGQEQQTGQDVTPPMPVLAKLSIDTQQAIAATTAGTASTTATTASSTLVSPELEQLDSPQQQKPIVVHKIVSPKALLSPTSPTTKKRNTTTALQQIFTSPTVAKPLHSHYVSSPITERANPALGLTSLPMSPTKMDSQSNHGLMRGLSLRS